MTNGKQENKVVVTTYLPYSLANRIDKVAKLRRCKRSAALAEIISEYFEQQDTNKQPCPETTAG